MDKSTIDKSNDDIIGQKDRQRRDGDGRQKSHQKWEMKDIVRKVQQVEGSIEDNGFPMRHDFHDISIKL